MSYEIEQQVERQLERQRAMLRRPSAALDARIAAEIESASNDAPSPRTLGGGALFAWAPIATAAAVAIAAAVWFTVGGDGPSAIEPREIAGAGAPGGGVVQPVVLEREWSQIVPGDEIVIGGDAQAYRPARVQRVRQTQWIDETNDVTIELTMPEAERDVLLRAAAD